MLWQEAFNLRLGANHDIKIQRVIMLYDEQGACAYSQDPAEDLLIQSLDKVEDFHHEVFNEIREFYREDAKFQSKMKG